MFICPCTVPSLCSEGSMFRRFYVPKVLYSEGSIFRRFYVPKVLCSECPLVLRSIAPDELIILLFVFNISGDLFSCSSPILQ